MTTAAVVILSPDDDVAVATRALVPGEAIAEGVVAAAAIPAGHKVAIRPIARGQAVVKYGQVIGEALRDVAPGEHVHVEELGFGAGDERRAATPSPAPAVAPRRATFQGYARADGRAGTRNYVGVVASVNCSTTVCRKIAEIANRDLLPRFPGIDGFVPIVHGQGCGSTAAGDGPAILRRTLAGYLRHPNFGGSLLIGLGCEVNQIVLYAAAGREAPVTAFNIQDVGGSRAAVTRALELLEGIAAEASKATRVPIDASELKVGLQCGGSDGFSGLTANPALGAAMDRLVAAGGTAILSETPEIWGAEHLLTARATPEVAAKLAARLAWWERYVAATGASLDNNPSPGNKRGGLTTILEKSLGAVAKGGRSRLVDVVDYAAPVAAHGLVFMDTPGYDPVSATGQVAGGANLVVFTTGRGSCFGCRPTPSIKVASNSDLAARMAEDIDVDAGRIVSAGVSVDAVGEEIFELILEVASGRQTMSEAFGYGDDEFVPWHVGAVL
ncbi:UxaA family hydrolase [Pinisolibacter aquiterrae]|uniref:UxaA family hydrolase n=1 Tax=Pinisolibacter aquiterrae TaxID=2815579 RepID=UPI001C3DA297|nr:altronate dehydratase family protein [Pinisolibacter aquiterrae]MBV5264798.1 altronate dehydratase [Pinisolibacter aquiterrae]MCC8234217.1 altronate dehydratase family protein [Pinisolibacter aquiterrae]